VPEIKVVNASELDLEAFSGLQREAFEEVLESAKVSDAFIRPSFFKWKYHPPAGEAKIALVIDDGKLVASNSMIPCEVGTPNTVVRAWQSCDTATAPQGRGKGYFMKCLHALQESLSANEIFYGFPNQNSIRGFQKIGWQETSAIRFWINPISAITARQSMQVCEVQHFDDLPEGFAQGCTPSNHASVIRSPAFLNWRYARHPEFDYTLFALGEMHVSAIAIARPATIMGRNFLVLMEFHGTNTRDKRRLLRHLCYWAKSKGLMHMIAMHNDLGIGNALAGGFYPVPHRLSPKKQVLMGEATTGQNSSELMTIPWEVQIGDWDAF